MSNNHRNSHFVLGLTTASLLVLGSASAAIAQFYGPRFIVEYNTDRQGGDYRSLNVAHFGQCLDECANDANCRAATYVPVNGQPPAYNNNTPKCWLKNSVPGQRRETGMITVIRQ